MTSVLISLVVGLLAFGGGLAGMLLQRHLPSTHMSEGSRDMIGALVLGTLVGSAYTFYATQKTEVEGLASRSIQLDMELAEFGPETQVIRAGLKQAMTHAYEVYWRGLNDDPAEHAIETYLPALKALDLGIASLSPETAAQKQLVQAIASNAGVIEQTRLLTSLQLASPVPWPLLVVVVSWAVFLFCGFGALSQLNATSIAALSLGAFAVASAVFLILGLNDPYSFLFHIPAAAMEHAIGILGR
jgi:hypothetical protein